MIDEDEDQYLLPLDERFRRSEQFELDLYPDYQEEKRKKAKKIAQEIIQGVKEVIKS